MKCSRFVFGAAVWGSLLVLLAVAGSNVGIAQSLGTVHTVFVAPVEASGYSAALGKRLTQQLERSGSIRVVSDEAAADAVLHASGSIWISGVVSPGVRANTTHEVNYQGNLSAELISRDRQTLWSYMVTPSHFRSASITDDLADQLAARLVAAVRSGIAFPISSGATAAGSSVTIRGAGSTLPAPLYLKWFESYAQARTGVTILYDPVGSETGIERLKAGAVDFAGSDIPISAVPGSKASSTLALPTVLAAVVPIYNLPSLEGRTLNLTPQALAGIYSGTIRKWNDPAIRESNRGAHLPDADIVVFHRSDGSGTTYIWTSFLSLVSADWKSHYGAHPDVSWPVGTPAQGSDGIAQAVSRTPNSIGYVELIYALQHRINFAAVRNPAGQFVKASIQSVSDAVSAASSTGEGDNTSILNAPSRDAYPISAFTWIFVPEQSSDASKRAAILEFLRWMLTSGQKECEALGYVPLPRRVAAHHVDLVNQLK
jgi:phosphate transport system substrate-binding protein